MLFRSNVGATALLDRVAREQELDPKQCVVGLYVAKEQSLVAVYLEKPSDDSQIGVRRLKGKSPKAGFLMGGLFEEHPELKANFTRDCKISREVDASGVPHLVIPLGSALEYVGAKGTKVPTKKEETNGDGKPGTGTEDGSDKTEGAAPGNQ